MSGDVLFEGLIQAPMAGVQNSRMAIEVCRAGGLGSIPAAMLSLEALAKEIETTQEATSVPFNVNFFAHTMLPLEPTRQRLWQEILHKYFREYDIDPQKLPEAVQRLPFSLAHLEVLQQYRPAVVSFHFGLPEERLFQAVKDTGAKVIASATTVAEAYYLAERGVDAVIAQGSEAGGHRGMFLNVLPGHEENLANVATQLGTFALLPQVVEAMQKYNLPVIASGGLAGGTSFKAAKALGASAVQVGTSYLLSSESLIGPLHRAALLAAKADPSQHVTALTNVFTGKPARSLATRLMRELRYIHRQVNEFPYASQEISALRAAAEPKGVGSFTPMWCGQNLGACEELPAYEITQKLLAQWEACR